MTLETKLVRLKELILKREEIDTELAVLLGVEKKTIKCSKCGVEGHTARTCQSKRLPAMS